MTVRMGDAIFPNNIPVTADQLDAVAGYVGGRWPDYGQEVVDWPALKHLSIAVNASERADCLDVETGDATPTDIPGWLAAWTPGNTPKPVLYTSAANMPGIVTNAGRTRSEYLIWSAHYTDLPHVCGPQTCGYWQADGTQWTDHGGIWDESVLNDNFFNTHGGSMARNALPELAVPVSSVSQSWKPDGSEYHVLQVGKNGHVYHDWYVEGTGWFGPEDLTGAG